MPSSIWCEVGHICLMNLFYSYTRWHLPPHLHLPIVVDNPHFLSIESTLTSSIVEDESKPLWQYVTKNQRWNEGSGNISWQCNFCHCIKKSSYTRVKAHLLGLRGYRIGACNKVPSFGRDAKMRR